MKYIEVCGKIQGTIILKLGVYITWNTSKFVAKCKEQ